MSEATLQETRRAEEIDRKDQDSVQAVIGEEEEAGEGMSVVVAQEDAEQLASVKRQARNMSARLTEITTREMRLTPMLRTFGGTCQSDDRQSRARGCTSRARLAALSERLTRKDSQRAVQANQELQHC